MQEVIPPQVGILVRSAREQFEAAQKAQRTGDWGGFGQSIEALGQSLDELEALVE